MCRECSRCCWRLYCFNFFPMSVLCPQKNEDFLVLRSIPNWGIFARLDLAEPCIGSTFLHCLFLNVSSKEYQLMCFRLFRWSSSKGHIGRNLCGGDRGQLLFSQNVFLKMYFSKCISQNIFLKMYFIQGFCWTQASRQRSRNGGFISLELRARPALQDYK